MNLDSLIRPDHPLANKISFTKTKKDGNAPYFLNIKKSLSDSEVEELGKLLSNIDGNLEIEFGEDLEYADDCEPFLGNMLPQSLVDLILSKERFITSIKKTQCNVEAPNAQRLLQLVERLQHLKEINIKCWLTENIDPTPIIITAARNSVEVVRISNANQMQNPQILATLAENNSLREVHFSRSNIGDIGAQVLAQLLRNNPSVQVVKVNGDSIGDRGAIALADALRQNESVTEVDLLSNQISTSGAQALAQALEGNKSVTTINLSYNPIGDSGLEALAKSLEDNDTLKRVTLSSTRVSSVGAKALAESLKKNNSVEEVDLQFNPINPHGIEALNDVFPTDTKEETHHTLSALRACFKRRNPSPEVNANKAEKVGNQCDSQSAGTSNTETSNNR